MEEAASGFRVVRAMGAIALIALLALGFCASAARAAPLSMEFTEARANVGVQLDDEALFWAPDTAPFEAQIAAGGAITAGALDVPDFATFITEPIDAFVTVEFEIGAISGSFNQATGALSLSGTAGGTLTSEGRECAVSTTPAVLTLTTSGNSGGDNPRSGTPFTSGLTEAGAIAGQWTDMHATPLTPEDTTFCSNVDSRIGGPGGVWLEHDSVPPGRVAAGGFHTCAIKADSTPVCWGSDDEDQATISPGVGTVRQISSGEAHTCAVKIGGAPVCWGLDDVGQATLPAGIGTVRQISAGGAHTCAVKTDGTPVCWGRTAPTGPQPTLPTGIGTVIQIAAGDWHSCAIKADDTAICWAATSTTSWAARRSSPAVRRRPSSEPARSRTLTPSRRHPAGAGAAFWPFGSS